MPFKSQAQRAFMYSQHPDIAKRWEKLTPKGRKLPEHVKTNKKVASKNWIAGAIKKKGSLRKSLGVKSGKNIPKSKLNKAAKKGGKMGARARLAKTLASFH